MQSSLIDRERRQLVEPTSRVEGPGPDGGIDACGQRWCEAMRAGNFEQAWQVSDAVLRRRRAAGGSCWHWPRHLQFVWTGVPLERKRVLVRCYHGLGDTIQFARFATPLRQVAREVIFWAQPELVRLIETVPGVDQVLPLHNGAPEVDFDADIEIMELPHALRTTLATLPREVPYLFARAVGHPANDARRVGIVWQVRDWDLRRAIPAALLAPLAEVPGIRLFSLQCGAARAQAATIPATDISDDDVTEAAARIRGLDLVISVDTMVAHLASALGVPTWTLLHADCDWRWMQGRCDSPWYPTMRLFRQQRAGDWRPVIGEVEAALTLWSRQRG